MQRKLNSLQPSTTLYRRITTINENRNYFKRRKHFEVKFIDGIKSKDADQERLLTNIDSCLTVIKNKYSEFNTTGNTLMVKFIDGIKSKDASVSNTFIQIISNCLTKIENKYTDFYNAGKYLVEGFAEGITANTFLAEARARAMAAAAARAAEKELDINSPSKVSYGIGSFFGLGFVNALDDYKSNVGSSAKDMGNMAINSLKDAISNVADVVSGDLDLAPTIRPVLDLTDVQAGKKSLYNMFSDGLNVTGTNRRVSSMLNEIKSDSSTLGSLIDALSNKTKAENQSVLSFEGMFKGAEFNVRSDSDITKSQNKYHKKYLSLIKTFLVEGG